MSIEVLIALFFYALVSSLTPGPNNFMLLASGVNYGYRRTLPHMFGISTGFLVMIASIGFGLGQLLEQAPVVFTAIKFAGGTYLLYLAWRIATAGSVETGQGGGRPLTLVEAAAFQWVNPKAWVLCVTAITTYTEPERFGWTVALVMAMFVLVMFPSNSVWAGFGMAVRGLLADPVRLRVFNVAMALALVASLWPMLR